MPVDPEQRDAGSRRDRTIRFATFVLLGPVIGAIVGTGGLILPFALISGGGALLIAYGVGILPAVASGVAADWVRGTPGMSSILDPALIGGTVASCLPIVSALATGYSKVSDLGPSIWMFCAGFATSIICSLVSHRALSRRRVARIIVKAPSAP